MSKFRPYSKDTLKLFKKSPLMWIALIGAILTVICYFFFMIYVFAGGKAFKEMTKHENVYQTSYKYDLCRKAYLDSDDAQYSLYRGIFNKLDMIFIGPMNITTYNNGIDLYSKQSYEFKLDLNSQINRLTDDIYIPQYKKETSAIRFTYLSNDLLTTYASNTKISLASFGFIFCMPSIAFLFLFELPNKDLKVSSVIWELLPR